MLAKLVPECNFGFNIEACRICHIRRDSPCEGHNTWPFCQISIHYSLCGMDVAIEKWLVANIDPLFLKQTLYFHATQASLLVI